MSKYNKVESFLYRITILFYRGIRYPSGIRTDLQRMSLDVGTLKGRNNLGFHLMKKTRGRLNAFIVRIGHSLYDMVDDHLSSPFWTEDIHRVIQDSLQRKSWEF